MADLSQFVGELRRRNVFRMAVLYGLAAWLIMQVAGVLIDLAKLPDWIGSSILWLLGFNTSEQPIDHERYVCDPSCHRFPPIWRTLIVD